MVESRFEIILADMSNNKDKSKLLHLCSENQWSKQWTGDTGLGGCHNVTELYVDHKLVVSQKLRQLVTQVVQFSKESLTLHLLSPVG